MMDLILGGEGRHLERPFCSSGGCPVVSPLTYERNSSEVCIAATRMGGNVAVVIAPQAGATAPAALAGAYDIREHARQRVRKLLSSHYPEYIDRATDEKIRERFPIALPREAMRPGNGRW
jgi:trimethylamine:corrinoid methyltransferase-like protein